MTDRTSSKTFHRPAQAELKSRREGVLHTALVQLARLFARQAAREHVALSTAPMPKRDSAENGPGTER